MKQNDTIKQELNQISPLIVSIGNRNGFKVPENYFEFSADRIVSGKNAFDVDEILSAYSKVSPFVVPENYFIDVAAHVLEKAKTNATIDDELLIPKISSFKVDENYFTDFTKSLSEKLAAEKWKEELITMENFSVPENYFETNPDKFLQAAKNSTASETKVISIFSKTYFKFSAAAAITAIIVGLAFLFQSQPSSNINQELTAQEIKCYLQNHTEEVDDLQLTEKVVKADERKINSTKKMIQPSVENEKQELKNYLENELDETELNDAI